MKNKILVVFVAVLLIITGCKKDDVMPKQMTISFLCEVDFSLVLTGIGIAIIDWGDSSTDTVTLPDCKIGESGALYIRHIYSELSTDHITITITGENITGLGLFDYLTNLDVSRNEALKELMCSGIQLTTLNIRNNRALTRLDCDHNQLTNLDVSQNEALTQLHCGYNQLTNLNVSKNINLDVLLVISNQFTTASLNALFKTLCNTANGNIYISNNPGTADCDRSIAEKKGWRFYGELKD